MCAKIGVVTPSQHDDLVRQSFERQVSLFSGPDSLFAKRIPGPQSWIEPLEPHMTVLDVACGAGHAADPLAPHVRSVVGVDLTRALLDVGAQRLRDAGITNVLLQEGNAEALPFVDESFDIVFCRAALHHIGDPKRAVAEMVRVCRVGGRVVLMDLLAPSPAEDIRTRFDDVHRRIDPSHRRAFTEAELAALLPVAPMRSYTPRPRRFDSLSMPHSQINRSKRACSLNSLPTQPVLARRQDSHRSMKTERSSSRS
jgi:SAM-dependent methyltransferase